MQARTYAVVSLRSQRSVLLAITSAYGTVFRKALLVVSCIEPIVTLAQECWSVFLAKKQGKLNLQRRRKIKTAGFDEWQSRWDATLTSCYTYGIFLNVVER